MKVTSKAAATGKKDEKAKVLENNPESNQRLRASSEHKDMVRSHEAEVRVRRSASMSRTGRGKVASKEVTRSGDTIARDNDVMAVDDITTKTKATMVVRLHPGHLQKIAANSQKQVSR